MRTAWWVAAALIPLVPVIPVVAAGAPGAGAPVMLGGNPSECEIARALLGAAPADCPTTAQPVPAVPVAPPPPAVARPAAAPPLVERKAAFLINFDFASTRIRPESRVVLDRVAAVMAAPSSGDVRFRIVGHTDDVGSDAGNLSLSRRRAAAVKDYLVHHHRIAATRLDALGMGKREPLDSANPRAAENRRVEIVSLSAK